MSKWLIKNGTFITMNNERPVYEGVLAVEHDRITYMGEHLPENIDDYDDIIDGRHRLYMPGFVNTHNHAAMSLLRGYADDLALQVWLEQKIWPSEAKFTHEDVRWGSALSIVEMIRGGTTCFVDMYDRMDEVARTVDASGMRACLTRGMINFGGQAEQEEKLQESTTFAKNWHGQANGRITTMLSPHASYTCPPEFIERIVEAATELDLPIHTHMSETIKEVEQNVHTYGERPVKHLQKLGVFDRPCLLAHAVHLTDEEISILQAYGVHISHNPSSNLKLASGIARVPELLKAGVLVSLGTDSSASNNNLDLLEEIRLAALLHKGQSGDPEAVPAYEALKMGTVYGAQSIWLDDVGALEVGMKADFIALNMDQPHFYPYHDFVSHVVYAASSQDVTDVWIDGQAVMRQQELLTLDEEKIKREFNLCYERLFKRS